MAGIGYRPEIDGLRAFAVIPVILFHMGLSWMPGGYIGVDVFFVISGYLITSIIKKELDQGTFSFRDFWTRRVRRILPAMIFVTGVTLAVTYAFCFGPDQQAIGEQGLAALLSVANIYFWRSTGDYWGPAAEESPFLHAWSLSVEEQFYLFFPVAMWLIFRFRSRWLQGCILSATVGSLALFLWGSEAYPTPTFYLLPTRVWELGTGCLLAVSLTNQSRENSSFGIFAIAGLGMIVASYLFIDKPNGGIGLAVVGTALIIAFGQTGLCNKLLSRRSVVHIGKVSYSLYLWHWPVLVLAKPLALDLPSFLENVVLVGATYLFALGTYHLVEKPTRRRSGIVPVILVSGTLVAMASLGLAWSESHYDTSAFEKARVVRYDCRPNLDSESIVLGDVLIEFRGYKADAYSRSGIRVGDESMPPDLVVLGDSHANMWSEVIAEVARELNINTAFFVIGGGESPFFEIPPKGMDGTGVLTKREKLEFDIAGLRALEEGNPSLVVISTRWCNGHLQTAGPLLELLKTRNCPVLLIEDPPELNTGNRNVMQLLAWKGLLPKQTDKNQACFLPCRPLAKHEGKRASVRQLASRYDNVQVLPTYDLYASREGAKVLDGRTPLYLDDDHLTSQGAMIAKPRMRDAIHRYFSRPQ